MKRILITGAGGYLGARIARALLATSDAELLLWIHARPDTEAEKGARLLEELGASGGRARLFAGDLTAPEPFAALSREHPTHVVHAAAVTRFNVERELARAVNVEGTRKLLDFARGRDGLEGLDLVSTVYASGLRPGHIPEEPLTDEHGFANHYEWSKWEAERLVIERSSVPWRILRVCTVIADDAGGAPGQQNAFHNTLKLLYYGLLSLVPGDGSTSLYFATAADVERAVLRLLERPARPGGGSVVHVSPALDRTLTLGRLIELAFQRFREEEDFRRRRILPPLFTDLGSFELLASGVQSGMGGNLLNEAVSSVAPFARQLFVKKEIANERLVAALDGQAPAPTEPLIARVCEHLVATRWGRKPAPSHA